MFYIILLIAGVVLAANRKQQAGEAASAPTVAQSGTVMLPHFTDIVDNFLGADVYRYPVARGPGIGAPLSANNPSLSNIIVSGPIIYRPDKGAPPAGAPAVAASAAPSAGVSPGSGGTGYGPPSAPHLPNAL